MRKGMAEWLLLTGYEHNLFGFMGYEPRWFDPQEKSPDICEVQLQVKQVWPVGGSTCLIGTV